MTSERRRVLLLGGTGVMGGHLSERLKDECDLHITSRSFHEDEKIAYFLGDAKEDRFLKEILSQKWDIIVDFLVYSTPEFSRRCEALLAACDHYVFISSARVYARSRRPITEESPRLLEVCEDEEYLSTDEYALAKARQEDVLKASERRNWTIIRPTITYGAYRMQLGVLEKEGWLYRAMRGRTIVFSEDIAGKITTMTAGCDVARGIAEIMGRSDAMGEVFHITDTRSYRWSEILEVYLDVLQDYFGRRPKVRMTEKSTNFKLNKGAKYQIIYSRYFNRRFDNSKIGRYVDLSEMTDAKEGVRKCLVQFLKDPMFNAINWQLEALNDRTAGEITPLSEIDGFNGKVTYVLYRLRLDVVVDGLRKVKTMIEKGADLLSVANCHKASVGRVEMKE